MQAPISQQLMQRLEAVDALKEQYRRDLIIGLGFAKLMEERLEDLQYKIANSEDMGYTKKTAIEMQREITLLLPLVHFYKELEKNRLCPQEHFMPSKPNQKDWFLHREVKRHCRKERNERNERLF